MTPITLLRVIPTLTLYSDKVPDVSSGSIYGMYIQNSIWHSLWHITLTFCLAIFLAFYLSYFLTFCLAFYLAYIFWHSVWHSIWHSVWHSLWHGFGSRRGPLHPELAIGFGSSRGPLRQERATPGLPTASGAGDKVPVQAWPTASRGSVHAHSPDELAEEGGGGGGEGGGWGRRSCTSVKI